MDPGHLSAVDTAGTAIPGVGRGLRRLHWTRGVSEAELGVFTRQLATLLRAGVPLVRGLDILGRQERSVGLRPVIHRIAGQIRAGKSFSQSLAEHPRVFDRLYVSMVRAGEAAGGLDPVLERLARFAEARIRLRARMRAAMIYPAVVLAAAGGVLTGLVAFVVPRFQQLFADLLRGAALPALTQAVLDVSALVRAHGAALLATVAAIVVALALARRTRRGQRWCDTVALRAPVFGKFLAKSLVARLARTLGTLLASGVPVLVALAITRETCGNARIAETLTRVHDRVKAGEPMSQPLGQSPLIPPLVTSLVEIGEHTGQLPAMLARVAEIYEEEVETASTSLGAALEPLLILVLAAVVGVIVVALFLPIVRIVQLLA